MKAGSELIYFISETHYFSKDYSILNITLVGSLKKRNIDTFRSCVEQVSQSGAKCVIFNFRDVVPETTDLEDEVFALVKQLFMTIRERPALLRVSGVHPNLRPVFLAKSLVSAEEIVNNLADALQSFLPLDSRKSA